MILNKKSYKKRMIILSLCFLIIALALVVIDASDINNSSIFWSIWVFLFTFGLMLIYHIGLKKEAGVIYFDFDYQEELKIYSRMIKKSNKSISYFTSSSKEIKRSNKGKNNQNDCLTYSNWKKHISDYIKERFFENPNNNMKLEDFTFYLNNKKLIFEDFRFAIGNLLVPIIVLLVTLLSNAKKESFNYLIDTVDNTIEINTFSEANYTVISCVISVIIFALYLAYDIGKAGIENSFIDNVIAICDDSQKKEKIVKYKKEIREKLTVDLLVDFISSDEI